MSEVRDVEFRGEKFYFHESPLAATLIKEIFNDNYKLFARHFEVNKGDIIVDIGANEGMFSIMMAKMYPGAKIISVEAVPRTFFQFIRNIGLNGVTNIEPVNIAIGKGKTAVMNVHNLYSGGSSMVDTFDPSIHTQVTVDVISLNTLFDKYHISKENPVKLLKMDIEGGEYAALDGADLSCVRNMVGEFHINNRLANEGRDINALATWIGARTNLMFYEQCRMAD